MMRARLPGLLLVLLVGCGGGGSGTPTTDAGPEPDATAPIDDHAIAAHLEIVEHESPNPDWGAWARVNVLLFDAPIPRWHTEADREGACTLWVREIAQCDPGCLGFCVGDFMCRPFPTLTPAGTLTVGGLTRELVLTHSQGYYSHDGELPADLFTDGAQVTLSAAGGERPAFALATAAPVRLTGGPLTDELDLNGTGDVTVRWTAADPGSRVRLTLNANSSGGHGSPYQAIIACETDDAQGQVVVSRRLLDAFPRTYRWEICAGSDCPMSTLRRYRRSVSQVDGGDLAGLTVASERLFFILHDEP
jgi:hypothetical protein